MELKNTRVKDERCCKDCAYKIREECCVIIWKEGEQVRIGPVPDDGCCELFEASINKKRS